MPTPNDKGLPVSRVVQFTTHCALKWVVHELLQFTTHCALKGSSWGRVSSNAQRKTIICSREGPSSLDLGPLVKNLLYLIMLFKLASLKSLSACSNSLLASFEALKKWRSSAVSCAKNGGNEPSAGARVKMGAMECRGAVTLPLPRAS